jgi:type IV secretory pathway TrbF-like protein
LSSTDASQATATPDSKPYNPYLAARREWDERYGDLITRARNWRLLALTSSLVALAAVAGMALLASRSRIIPFVVAIDSLGRPVATGLAEQATSADDRLRRATVLSWIEDLRTVTTDGIAQRRAIDRVYAHIANGSEAQPFVSEFYRNDPPQKRAQTETTNVDVKSVLPTSDRTVEVEWIETTRDLYGAVQAQERWKGAFTITVSPPSDERLVRMNPLGVYITNASWTRVL